MAGRPRALDDAGVRMLERMVAAGIPQATIARALSVSQRTVSRYASGHRRSPEPETLGELLEALAVGRRTDGVPWNP